MQLPRADRRWGPLYGYIVASVIFSVVIYALLFQTRSQLVDSCHRVNHFRVEVNQRAPVINALVRIERREPEHQQFVRHFHRVKPVELVDCEAAFPKPTPFG